VSKNKERTESVSFSESAVWTTGLVEHYVTITVHTCVDTKLYFLWDVMFLLFGFRQCPITKQKERVTSDDTEVKLSSYT